VAKVARYFRLGAKVVQDGKSAQRFRPNPGLFSPGRQIDHGRVTLHGLNRPAAQVVPASFTQQSLEARVAERTV
jgi:hypothetical protein